MDINKGKRKKVKLLESFSTGVYGGSGQSINTGSRSVLLGGTGVVPIKFPAITTLQGRRSLGMRFTAKKAGDALQELKLTRYQAIWRASTILNISKILMPL